MEQGRREDVQRVEPAARLIEPFRHVVERAIRPEGAGLERVVELGERRGAAIVPHVDGVRLPAGIGAAVGAVDHEPVDGHPVGVEPGGIGPPVCRARSSKLPMQVG